MACYDATALELSSRIAPPRSQRSFFATVALIFAASAALTIFLCSSMSQMPSMRMPGGWTMSMTWMRMPGQSWIAAGAWFLLMWTAMMVPMMLPSLAPMLLRYRESLGRASNTRRAGLTTLAGLAYFFVWILIGLAVYPLGILLANYEMRSPAFSRAVPFCAAVMVLLAGIFQLTSLKSRLLAHCHDVPVSYAFAHSASSAWRHGLRLGVHCACCCANLMLILLVIDLMDLRTMTLLTAAITLERFAPAESRAAHVLGLLVVFSGLILIARAAGLRRVPYFIGSCSIRPQLLQNKSPGCVGVLQCPHTANRGVLHFGQNRKFGCNIAPQCPHATCNGCLTRKYRMNPSAFGTKITRQVHRVWFIPRRFESRFTYPISNTITASTDPPTSPMITRAMYGGALGSFATTQFITPCMHTNPTAAIK